jgi:aldehyde dehydrogenase (NAD+)
MGYIDAGKKQGATVHLGGERHGQEGYFIQPTVFTECTPEMTIVREEIFGPVVVIIKFKTEEGKNIFVALHEYLTDFFFVTEAIDAANSTSYGLSCSVFTQNNSRALRVAHQLEAGTAWVSEYAVLEVAGG